MDISKLLKVIDLVIKLFQKPVDPIPAAVEAQAHKEAIQAKTKVFTLLRLERGPNGVFSTLSLDGQLVCYVAEHAYDSGPKLPNGDWTVELGIHTLDHGGPKQLYCVQNVPGHSGICFHIGNYPEHDSDGCLLLGQSITTLNNVKMVTNSDYTFQEFMKSLSGVQSFNLTVVG